MAYSDPGDAVSGAVITEAWGDAVRADVIESALAIVAAKGDLAVATALNVLARLAVGADGSILEADSGEATGLLWQIVPTTKIYHSIDQAIGLAVWTSLDFDLEHYDSNAMHSILANTERITCPDNGDGIYHFEGNVTFNSGGGVGGNDIGMRILLNGGTVIARNMGKRSVVAVNVSLIISCDYVLSDNGGGANDYVELQVYTETGYDVFAIGDHTPEFSARWTRMTP